MSSAPASASSDLDLVDAACKKKLGLLSKEGAAAHRRTIASIMFVGMVVAGGLFFFFRANYNATDVDSATRGWIRLAYWLTVPATPAFLFAGIWNLLRAARAQSAGAFALKCPSCGATHELSEIFRKGFNLTCPTCYSVIDGSGQDHMTKRSCSYCSLGWFGRATGDCPGCRGSNETANCPHCKASIARGAIGCVHCNQWLKDKESGFGEGSASYDVTRFGPKLARAYAVGIWERIEPVATDLDALLTQKPDPKQFSPGEAGSVGGGLSEPTRLLHYFALAAQWLRRPGLPVEPLPPEIGAALTKLEANVAKCDAAGMKLEDALRAARAARRSFSG
jgi:hypothetical protein